MILLPGGAVRHGECWFDDEPEPGVDVVHFVQCPERRSRSFSEFYSPVIDLDRGPDEILGAMKSGTQKDIRRARDKDLLRHEWITEPSAGSVEEFCDYYDDFALLKSLGLLNRQLAHAYREAGVLVFSRVWTPDNVLVSWRALYFSSKRVRGLWGPSLFRTSDDSSFRQLTGRATRYNHYCSMLCAKEMGVRLYDLGGWYAGDTDQARLSINKFKEGFGAEILTEYNGALPMTMRGRAYLIAKNLKQRIAR